MFLPTTQAELAQLGWDRLDVILVSGDSYIDSPYIGTAVIGKLLLRAGYRVGVIAQPELSGVQDIGRLGTPRLFWGVSAGSVDSMVANYTALNKKRRQDDYTPGGLNNLRPDRATIVYTNLIRRYMKQAQPDGPPPPVVLGGIEASLRRVAHYDYWTDRVRRSVLLDAKADYLLYGMAEKTVLALAESLRSGEDPRTLRGLCYLDHAVPQGYLELPDYETVAVNKSAFIEMFHTFYNNNDPLTAKGLAQKHAGRYLVQNPPTPYASQAELDAIYALDFERAQHPYYERQGPVRALDTICFSISTHRGCYGECSFCAIAVHEGRTVRWRSPESLLAEAGQLTRHPRFKGVIQDVGGPTANMYGYECAKKLKSGACPKKRCLYPRPCTGLPVDHRPQMALLEQIRRLPGVKHVFVASGIRYDLALADKQHGEEYIEQIACQHVSGQLKVAPEHSEPHVLRLIGKPPSSVLLRFKNQFERRTQAAGKKQYLTYYLIAAHPGCTEADMQRLKEFTSLELHINPEQVQIFTPTPSTYATLMYYTGRDPFSGKPIFVEKSLKGKARQKEILARQKQALTHKHFRRGGA